GSALHWDGAQWNPVATQTNLSWNGVWGFAPDDLWVAGEPATMLHWNGTQFDPVAVARDATNANLTAIRAITPNLWYAVGEGGTILRWDGTVWTLQTSPVTTRLLAVWGSSPNDVHAAGDGGV